MSESVLSIPSSFQFHVLVAAELVARHKHGCELDELPLVFDVDNGVPSLDVARKHFELKFSSATHQAASELGILEEPGIKHVVEDFQLDNQGGSKKVKGQVKKIFGGSLKRLDYSFIFLCEKMADLDYPTETMSEAEWAAERVRILAPAARNYLRFRADHLDSRDPEVKDRKRLFNEMFPAFIQKSKHPITVVGQCYEMFVRGEATEKEVRAFANEWITRFNRLSEMHQERLAFVGRDEDSDFYTVNNCWEVCAKETGLRWYAMCIFSVFEDTDLVAVRNPDDGTMTILPNKDAPLLNRLKALQKELPGTWESLRGPKPSDQKDPVNPILRGTPPDWFGLDDLKTLLKECLTPLKSR